MNFLAVKVRIKLPTEKSSSSSLAFMNSKSAILEMLQLNALTWKKVSRFSIRSYVLYNALPVRISNVRIEWNFCSFAPQHTNWVWKMCLFYGHPFQEMDITNNRRKFTLEWIKLLMLQDLNLIFWPLKRHSPVVFICKFVWQTDDMHIETETFCR